MFGGGGGGGGGTLFHKLYRVCMSGGRTWVCPSIKHLNANNKELLCLYKGTHNVIIVHIVTGLLSKIVIYTQLVDQ